MTWDLSVDSPLNEDQDRRFLKEAYTYAKKHSLDPRTQNAAILVRPDTLEVISYGANTFPAGVLHRPERLETPVKYQYFEHAERAAIMSAARQGRATAGAVMYVPWFACADCAKAIIGAGIIAVVGHATPCSSANGWNASIDVGLTMFREAKVAFRYYDGTVGVQGMRFGGDIVDR